MAGTNEALVTPETVAFAADAIIARGERPSVRSIVKELGGGSHNSVLAALRLWKDARAATASTEAPEAAAEKPSADQPVKLDALPEVGPVIDSLVQAILAAVGRVQSMERKSAEAQLAAAMATHGAELAAHDRKHAADLIALSDDLDDTKAALEEALPHEAQAEDLQRQLNAAEASELALKTEKEELGEKLTALRQELKEASTARDTALAAAKRADDEASSWRDQLTKAQGDLAAARSDLTAARTEAEAKLEAAKKEAEGTITALRSELATEQSRLAEANGTSKEQVRRITDLTGDTERLRGERDAANAKLEALLERALRAETALAAAPKPEDTP